MFDKIYEAYPGQFEHIETHVDDVQRELLHGYMDGFDKDAIEPNDNRTEAYRFGWLNGRDDRIGEPRDTAKNLREELQSIFDSKLN